MAAGTQGSWYPSSFHGHFRSKHRNDFVNDYRQQAKPSPPGKFVRRLTSRPNTHAFSHHDNRFSFLNTVTSFQDGLGKKKVDSNHKSKFVPDFIAWVPHKREISQSGPLESVYRDTYRESESERTSYPQILVNTISKPKTLDVGSLTTTKSLPGSLPFSDHHDDTASPITTYQFAHRHMQPNRSIFTNMNTGEVETTPIPQQITPNYINPQVPSIYERPKTSLTRLRRARIQSAPNLRSSVAACLKWYDADDNENRPKTATGSFPELSQSTLSGSSSVPSISTSQLNNVNHYDSMKTSRIPATQIVQSSQDVGQAPVAVEEG